MTRIRIRLYRFFVGTFFAPIAHKLGFMHVADVCWTLDSVYMDLDENQYDDFWIARQVADDLTRTAIRRINPNF